MSSEARNEFLTESTAIVPENPRSGRAAIRQLDQLRSSGPAPQKTLDAEVARIAQEKLQPYRCDLVVHRMDDGVTRLSKSPVQKSCVLYAMLFQQPSFPKHLLARWEY